MKFETENYSRPEDGFWGVGLDAGPINAWAQFAWGWSWFSVGASATLFSEGDLRPGLSIDLGPLAIGLNLIPRW